MSGIKDVRVRASQMQRNQMYRATSQAPETVRQQMQREEMRQIAKEVSNSAAASITNRLETQVAGLRGDVIEIAEKQNLRLNELANSFEKTLEELKTQRRQDREEMQVALGKLKAREDRHKEQADFWISQSEAFFMDIEQYRHELFTPNQLTALRNQLSQIQQDIKLKAFQSAMASARSVFNQAVELKERVVQAEIEWAHYHTKLQQELAELKSDLFYHQTMKFIVNTEEGEEKVDANIDYWTKGKISEIAKTVVEIDAYLEQINEVSTAELVNLIERIKETSNLLVNARETAKDALISSNMRAEMANAMAEHFSMAGWEFAGCSYEENEMREALHIKFCDNIGNEIVTVISPEEIFGETCNNMQLNFFDPNNNDVSMRDIWVEGVLESLREIGLNVGTPITKPGYEVRQSDKEELRNLEIATAKASG